MHIPCWPAHKSPYSLRTRRRRLLGAVIGTILSIGAHAGAPDENSAAIAELTQPMSKIEVGAGMTSDNSFAAGNYTGLNRQGAFAFGNIDLRGSQYSYNNNTDDRTRWRLTGTNLGLNSRSLSGEYGRQGAYRTMFGYDEIPRLYSDSYQTPFIGAGSSNLTLPGGFVRGADTSALSTLAASMERFDVQATRKRAEVGLIYWPTREWEFRASLRNDDRDGTKIRGTEFGNNGGNPRVVLLPEPIDSSTQLIDASVAFTGDGHRFSFSYHGSLYKNNVGSLILQNPYSSAPWVGGGSGLAEAFPLPNGQAGVPPDNQFHQLTATGTYDFSSTTRVTMTGTRGRMTQNEIFLPYTINPGLASNALPRTSLNGVVETTFFNAKLSLRPVRSLSLNVSFRYEDRDNKTPQSEYIYVGGDSQLQPQAGSNSDRIRTNLPRSRRQIMATLDADYRISSTTSIKAGLDHEEVKRTFAEVEQAKENTLRLELRPRSLGLWTASASVAFLQRRGSPYLYNLPYLASYTSAAFISGLTSANGCVTPLDCVRNAPLQNKFYMSDRNRERARVMVGFMQQAAFSLQARVDVNRDRYPHSPYGVTDAGSWSTGIELGASLDEHLTASMFYTFEDQRSRERSRQITVFDPAVASSADTDWVNQLVDKTSSIGFGLRYPGLLGGRLDVSADAIAIRGRTPISTSVGAAVPAGQNPATTFPDLRARSHNINIAARYALDKASAVRVNYFFRRLSSADWAYQNVTTTTLANVIGTNEIPAQHSIHGIGISCIRTFR